MMSNRMNANSNITTNSNMTSNSNTMTNSANPMVGGAPMYANKDIIENATNSKDYTTLVAAVKAAGLVDTLKGAITEAFDEPLTKDQVLAIAGLFIRQ